MTPTDPVRQSNAIGIDFMRTEISLGLAFGRAASDAGDDTQKRDRNRGNAQKAYEDLPRSCHA